MFPKGVVFPTSIYLQANLPQLAAIHKTEAGSEPGSVASFPKGGSDNRWQPNDVYKAWGLSLETSMPSWIKPKTKHRRAESAPGRI